jgi:hypothetical protein
MGQPVVLNREVARRLHDALCLAIGGRVEVDSAQHRARRSDVSRRGVSLELARALGAAHMTAAHVLVDTMQRRRFVLGQRRANCLLDFLDPGIARLPPFRQATAVNADSVQSLDTIHRRSQSCRNLAAGLAAIKLLGHADLSPRNDPDAVGVGLIGSTGDLGVVQRRLGDGFGFEHLGRTARLKKPVGRPCEESGKPIGRADHPQSVLRVVVVERADAEPFESCGRHCHLRLHLPAGMIAVFVRARRCPA